MLKTKSPNEAKNGIIEEFKSKLSATEKSLKKRKKEIIKNLLNILLIN